MSSAESKKTITELLEAHVQHDAIAKSTRFYCLCGWVSEMPRYGAGRDEHREHLAKILEQNAKEREAQVLESLAEECYSPYQAIWIRNKAREILKGPTQYGGVFGLEQKKEQTK